MSNYESVPIQIAGRTITCEYGKVEAYIYRNNTDMVHNWLRIEEHGTQVYRLFNVARHIVYLSGIPLPDTGLNDKKLERLANSMDERYGWNCRVIMEDSAPEDVVERHIAIATKELQVEQLTIPESWQVS